MLTFGNLSLSLRYSDNPSLIIIFLHFAPSNFSRYISLQIIKVGVTSNKIFSTFSLDCVLSMGTYIAPVFITPKTTVIVSICKSIIMTTRSLFLIPSRII